MVDRIRVAINYRLSAINSFESLSLAKERCCSGKLSCAIRSSPKQFRLPGTVDLGSLLFIVDPWFLLRKEVIQPQVPLRLPCYDFIPITIHTFGTCLSCELTRRLRVQTAFMM